MVFIWVITTHMLPLYCAKIGSCPSSVLCEDEGSDTSAGSEIRLEEEEDSVEEDNFIAEIGSYVKSDEDE
jgi:hypothetical protein